MMFKSNGKILKLHERITNAEICAIFKCSPQGGMRRSKKTNTLILISDHTKNNPYQDSWQGKIFHYTGMGLIGDQSFDYRQNKTLSESASNGVEIHLFEIFDSIDPKYEYQGIVKLAGEPYICEQPDANGNMRKVCIFPLAQVNHGSKFCSLSKSISSPIFGVKSL